MKKLVIAFTMLLISQFGFGQAISDNAVIPVSVTLNSILRLTVTSGGNIQFVFNTMNDYTDGIGPGTRYTTTFNVASSRDFTVTMQPDISTFFAGLETGSILDFENNNIGYILTGAGATSATILGLQDTQTICTSGAGNEVYSLAWECGTVGGGGMNAATLLVQSLPADIYVQNIFLTLVPQP